MAGRMRLLGSRQAPLRVRRAGLAVLVHPKGGEDPRPLEFVARRAVEPGHTVVGLDVEADTLPEAYEELLEELGACPGILRLVPVRSGAASTLSLGAWLAERCGRTVLAYEGSVHPVVGGGLYIPSGAGAGWLRMEPGQAPVPHSRRFPRPHWECDPFDAPRSLGPRVAVEPLPAGVWIRPHGDTPAARAYRRLLYGSLQPDPWLPRVVLGYPGAPVAALSNLADFWGGLPAGLLPALRFARFGPSDGVAEPFGQALADAVDAPVTVSTGVRLTVPDGKDGIEARTLLPEGTMAWAPYAEDFGYVPSRSTRGIPADPVPISYRPPIAGLPEQQHGVYEYGEDAVLEVTQSGLWMRPAGTPSENIAIRSVPPEPGHAKVFFDTGDFDTAVRMQVLAQQAVAQLEPQVRAAVWLLAAGTVQELNLTGESARAPALESEPVAVQVLEPEIEPEPVPVPVIQPEPELVPEVIFEPVPVPVPVPEAVSEPELEAVSEAVPEPELKSETQSEVIPQPEPQVVPEPEVVPEPAAAPEPEPEPISFSRLQLVSSPDAAFESPALPELEPAPEPEPELELEVETEPEPTPAPIPAPAPAPAPTKTGPRVQPVPSARATAIPPAGGIAEERVWLRRNLSKQYDATASSVARVLSEYPGLRAGLGAADADVITDLVAVRLYLDGKTRNLDDAVRGATVGPHVPLARCVASGLRRLPSFRGVARLRADLNEAEWLWYSGNELVTEWSFSPVLTSGRVKLPGDVDILIWSMTARRTNLIDPALRDQAVFLPGTSFKRLRVGSGAGREIYLRELAQTEVSADGTVRAQQTLDEIALTSLEQAAEAMRRDEPTEHLDADHADRFSGPPGLIGRPASMSSSNGHSDDGHSDDGHSGDGQGHATAGTSPEVASSPAGAQSTQEGRAA